MKVHLLCNGENRQFSVIECLRCSWCLFLSCFSLFNSLKFLVVDFGFKIEIIKDLKNPGNFEKI